MKTKEIDVWVQDLIFDDKHKYCAFIEGASTQIQRDAKKGYTKCKLIFPLPEKKIEITEKCINDAWSSVLRSWYIDEHTEVFRDKLKKELGFTND